VAGYRGTRLVVAKSRILRLRSAGDLIEKFETQPKGASFIDDFHFDSCRVVLRYIYML
jgi:hypothetical protein